MPETRRFREDFLGQGLQGTLPLHEAWGLRHNLKEKKFWVWALNAEIHPTNHYTQRQLWTLVRTVIMARICKWSRGFYRLNFKRRKILICRGNFALRVIQWVVIPREVLSWAFNVRRMGGGWRVGLKTLWSSVSSVEHEEEKIPL